MKPLYLDYAATTPTDPRVLEAMKPYFLEQFGNASSPHAFGRHARRSVEGAREMLASSIGAKPTEIVFTSSASEANNQAIFCACRLSASKGRHIITSAIEHHSVLEPIRRLEQNGFKVSYVKPQVNGIVSTQEMMGAITPETILVCLQHANNEIGAIQPVEAIGRICRERGIFLLVDATQTVGHIPVDVGQITCDFLSLSAHKCYGPQGIGALYVRSGIELPAYILGGDQERGRRAGTLNVPGIVGLGEALKICKAEMVEAVSRESQLRDRLIDSVLKEISGAQLNGCAQARLPNNAHFSFDKIDGEALVSAMDMVGVAVSMGSACTWGKLEPSHVLRAMGLSDRQALASLRVTVGRFTTLEDISYFIEQLKVKVNQLRS